MRRPVSGPGGWAPAFYDEPDYCAVCAEERVSAKGEVCAGCAIDAEEDKAIPVTDTAEEEASIYGV